MSQLKKIFSCLFYLPKTLYFNFHYLPLKQAIKLPILLYKPKFRRMRGKIVIKGPITPGMIQLGFNQVSIYPNSGIMWENSGSVIFEGHAAIGNNSNITTSKNGILTFGSGFRCTTSLKLVCYNRVTFGNDVLIGWDCLISDTDFHSLHLDNGGKTKGFGEISIGNNNWFAMQCLVLKGSKTPNYCTLAARTMINKDFTNEGERILLSGQPAKVSKRDIYHDRYDDSIEYSQHSTRID